MVAVRAMIWCAGILALAGPSAGDEPPMVERRFSFEGGQFDNTRLRPLGIGTVKFLQPGPKGLRIAIPQGSAPAQVAFKPTCVPQGDFEFTVSYEALRLEKPTTGYGIGPGLYITMKSPGEDAASLSRRACVKEGDVFCAHYATTPALNNEKTEKSQQKRRHHVKSAPANQQAGKLRMVRSGAALYYYVVDGPGEDFRLIDQFPSRTDDIEQILVRLDRGGASAGAEVIWKDLVIRAQSFRGEGGQTGSRMRIVTILVVSFLMLAATGGGWYWWHRRKREASQRPAESAPADDQPASDQLVGSQPAGKQPANKQLVAKQSGAKQPAARQPTAKQPAGKPPAAKPPA